MSSNGWIKQMRNEKVLELLKLPKVLALVTQIAQRARRVNGFNADGLGIGEAMLGDYANIGLTRQEYRTALKKIEKLGIATIRTTNKGTIGKLTNTSIYDINIEGDAISQSTEQPTEQPSANHQATNKQPTEQPLTRSIKNRRMKEGKKTSYCPTSNEVRLSQLLLDLILSRKPDLKKPSIPSWCSHVERMIRLDGRSPERIEAVIRWSQADPFWQANILSTAKLREKFDTLEMQMQKPANGYVTQRQKTRAEIEKEIEEVVI